MYKYVIMLSLWFPSYCGSLKSVFKKKKKSFFSFFFDFWLVNDARPPHMCAGDNG